MKSPKNKGNSFERFMSKKLSLWLTDGQSDNVVWRTDTSGGRSTVKIKHEKMDSVVSANIGDLKRVSVLGEYPAVDLFFNRFMVELKCGYSNAFEMYPPLSKIFETIIDKAIKDSFNANKRLALIVKSDRKKILFISDYLFKNEKGRFFYIISILTDYPAKRNLYVYLLDDLLKYKFLDLLNKYSILE